MALRNFAFIDTETTGLDVDQHEIIEIGIVIVSEKKDDNGLRSFEVVEEVDFKIKPEYIERADPVALRVNGYTPADWVFAYTKQEGAKLLSQKVEGTIMVAHNAHFDLKFLDKLFKETNEPNTSHYFALDTISIAHAKLYKEDKVEKYSLRSLSEYFAIENKNAHTALSDARATYELYKKLMDL